MKEWRAKRYQQNVTAAQRMLIGLGLTNKAGENYYDAEKFAEGVKYGQGEGL
ncbi:MAG: hypothetical protein PHI98_09670 [Eubacteriales bacterium]|nr:hypothetical protein [Eubacteriales bacterium]